jgi:hypothetical protein
MHENQWEKFSLFFKSNGRVFYAKEEKECNECRKQQLER